MPCIERILGIEVCASLGKDLKQGEQRVDIHLVGVGGSGRVGRQLERCGFGGTAAAVVGWRWSVFNAI